MGLKEYQKKRDFAKSREPSGAQRPSQPGRLFVIHKHAARRLHFDVRLEIDGVLKSWAVPKGPSVNPADKRLAMHVEDHPVAYGGFEGVIPKGQYGGGTVMLWDRGQWQPVGDPREGYREGRLKFRLFGHKLRGGWTLVRIGRAGDDKSWLMIKERDEQATDTGELEQQSVASGRSMEQIARDADAVWESEGAGEADETKDAEPRKAQVQTKHDPIDWSAVPGAVPARMPATMEPELATLVSQAPEGYDWIHEIKFDGYRLLCRIDDDEVKLLTRRGQDWTERFGPVAHQAQALGVQQAIIDGEVVVMKADGTSDFQALQNVLSEGRAGELVYYAFDLPFCQGYDLRRVPLIERKKLLRRLLQETSPEVIRYSDHIQGRGRDAFQSACRLALEGIVSKRVQSPYESRRTTQWVKVKCSKRQEFVIAGFTDPTRSRQGLGALVVGYYRDGQLRYAGKVGTGFNDKTLRQLRQRLDTMTRSTPSLANPPSGREAKGVHWVEPKLVAEVEFLAFTEDGVLRHPAFLGLREDKQPLEVQAEVATAPNQKPAEARPDPNPVVQRIRLTNPDRVLYPEQAVTKRALATYYQTVGERMLPHLVRRPLSLVRCPQGHQKQCFFQKHFADAIPQGLYAIDIEEKGSPQVYCVVRDLAGIIQLVQLGVLEIHPWRCRDDRIELPDEIVFDLDPSPEAGWEAAVRAALQMRQLLEGLKLQSFVKTTGGKGLHVVVPLQRRADWPWDAVKSFSHAVADQMVRAEPSLYVATMSKAKRRGKVFIDYLRNGRGATAVAPWSTRAKTGAPVSMPLDWDELPELQAADTFHVGNVSERLRARAGPWQDYFEVRQSITKAAARAVGMQ